MYRCVESTFEGIKEYLEALFQCSYDSTKMISKPLWKYGPYQALNVSLVYIVQVGLFRCRVCMYSTTFLAVRRCTVNRRMV